MARKIVEKVIDGITYKVKQVGAETGGLFIFRVGRTLLAGLEGVDGFVAALQALPPGEFTWAMNVLKDTTTVGIKDEEGDGQTRFVALTTLYDDHFAGNYSAWGEWVAFAAEANFGSFLGDALAKFRARKEQSGSASPKAQTGSAGDSYSASA